MTQASRKKKVAKPVGDKLLGNLKEVSIIGLILVAIFLFISLFSFSPEDPAWTRSVETEHIQNGAGVIGAFIADVLLYVLGYFGYCFPILFCISGWRLFQDRQSQKEFDYFTFSIHTIGVFLTIIGACGIAWLSFQVGGGLPYELKSAGGILGDAIGSMFETSMGKTGGVLVLLAMFVSGITLYTGLSWIKVIDFLGHWTLRGVDHLTQIYFQIQDRLAGRKAKKEREVVLKQEKEEIEFRVPPKIKTETKEPEPSIRAELEKQEVLFAPPGDSVLPSLGLLDKPVQIHSQLSRESLEALSRQVELKLKDFGVTVEVVAVRPGPVVTRFEMQPAPGLKVSTISNLAKDLARSLSVVSVRIVEVIPGKSVIGLEIPNENRETVYLSEVINSREYEDVKSPLALGLGKDISGSPVITDLAKMPHLLVAGTTGSGKSVALNAMILSLLYKAKPSEIRMIMIDPKMLELSVYEGISHLLAPVVTDMKEAANALRWCVAEMERRYKLMSILGVRNISGYNRKIEEANKAGTPIHDPIYKPVSEEDEAPLLENLPYIVVIVDELADMMMTVGKKVEELIARLAQKARAAGIHLILATQRPSVDVITGLIKSNIPTRIAFQVSSKIDSRTILDQMGAEHLLGHGDMLFLAPGSNLTERVHGAFVSDEEVHKVADDIRSRGEPEYISAIISSPEEGGADPIAGLETANSDVDPLYDEAVRIVTETRKASISYIQRRLKIGYNRAARIVEEMESSGLLGPLESNGSREILAAPPPPID